MKAIFRILPVLFSLILTAGPALADQIEVGDVIYLYNGFGTTNGGDFRVAEVSDPTDILFRTFCVERDEYINYPPGASFTVTGITDTAMLGGVNTNSGDLLDPRTAYLYSKYIQGGTTYHTNEWADAFQLAIWYIEQEIGAASLTAQAQALYNEANLSGWSDIGNVRVMNLTWNTGGGTQYPAGTLAQDQLIYVPEPGVLILLGVGMLAVGGLLRRRI